MTADRTSPPPLDFPPISVVIAMLEAGAPPPMPPQERPTDTAALVVADPALASVAISTPAIDGPNGPVDARLYLPGPEVEPAGVGLVWAHGGAFIFGDLDMPEANWVGLALAARGIPVLSVDYRKALHGNRHPVLSGDVLAGWQWAVANAGVLGVDPGSLHLGGASAGGNLAAGVAKRLRDGAGEAPASLLLAYPVLHAVLPEPSAELRAAMVGRVEPFGPAETRELNLNYVGDEAGLADPYAFPANGSVAGYPPTYLLMSEFDGLRASGEAFAVQLAEAGVPVRAEFEPGAEHGQLNQPYLETGQRSVARMAAWLTGEIGPTR
jgi:acetyl esterase